MPGRFNWKQAMGDSGKSAKYEGPGNELISRHRETKVQDMYQQQPCKEAGSWPQTLQKKVFAFHVLYLAYWVEMTLGCALYIKKVNN